MALKLFESQKQIAPLIAQIDARKTPYEQNISKFERISWFGYQNQEISISKNFKRLHFINEILK